MKASDILRLRLFNQQIAESRFTDPAKLVSWMGAMQAQEYAMAKWAVGLRLHGFVERDIEAALSRGEILRTHCMRPTWHFVTPSDIRWIQALTSPRVQAFNAPYYRKVDLDSSVFKRSHDILARALEGGRQLTRAALGEVLAQQGIEAKGLRLACLLMCAELDCIVCSGARQGKQFTYALLDERAPRKLSRPLKGEEALAELARIYFTSRAPATLQDFSWWSGLTMQQVKRSIELLGKTVLSVIIEDREYFQIPHETASTQPAKLSGGKYQTTFLMPDYDEYGICYKDRRHLFIDLPVGPKSAEAYSHMMVIDGKVAGTWKPVIRGGQLEVETMPFKMLPQVKQKALAKAVKNYISFFKNP